MKLTSVERTIYALRELDGLSFAQISKAVDLTSSAVREKYNKTKRVVEAEKTDPVAKLNIDYSTYMKLCKARNHSERNTELGIDLYTIEGLIEAVNDRFETYNHTLYFDIISPIVIKNLIEALEEAGYELKDNHLDIGLSLTSDLICVRSERYIEFDIKDTSGIFKCESDGTNCQLFFVKQTKYPKDEIQKQIIHLMKEEGYIL